MPNLHTTWMNGKKLALGDTMQQTEALDVGEYQTLDLAVTVETADDGADAALVFEHAARNEAGCYMDFGDKVTVPLTVTGTTWVKIDRFTRFLGWAIEGTLNSGAVVSTDVAAKR